MKSEYKFNYKYNPKSNRLENYNYSESGLYFITICTKDKQEYFWEIINWKMILNEYWKIVEKYYLEIPEVFWYVITDQFIIMPNHIHFIFFLNKCRDVDLSHLKNSKNNLNSKNRDAINGHLYREGNGNKWWFAWNRNCMIEKWLWKIINWYKWRCTFEMNKLNEKIYFAWQSNYYDRIIRDKDNELDRIRKYIVYNPLKWKDNKENQIWIFM